MYSLSCIITRKFSLFFFGSVDTLLTIPLAQLVKLQIKVGGIIHDVPLHNHISPHYIFTSLLHLNPTLFRINIRKFHSAIIIGCYYRNEYLYIFMRSQQNSYSKEHFIHIILISTNNFTNN